MTGRNEPSARKGAAAVSGAAGITFDSGHARRKARSPAGLGVLVLLAGAFVVFALAPLAMPASFDWVEHGISESAAQGIDNAWIARIGFILFGLAVIWLAQLRHRAWGPLGTAMHLMFGVSMFGVAAFPTRHWDHAVAYVDNDDLLHSVFAGTIGFGFIAGVVAVMIARKLPTLRAAMPDLAALAITISVPLFMSADIWGALQRVMFLTAGLWYAREAWHTRSDPTDHRAENADGLPD